MSWRNQRPVTPGGGHFTYTVGLAKRFDRVTDGIHDPLSLHTGDFADEETELEPLMLEFRLGAHRPEVSVFGRAAFKIPVDGEVVSRPPYLEVTRSPSTTLHPDGYRWELATT
ncbi:MAG: hypothetical protein ACOYLF_17920 [Blastocatellia bacterium]